MTTAARPQFVSAKGGRSIRDNPSHPVTQYNVRELPENLTLKFRQPGQNTEEEIRRRNIREELRKAELEHLKEIGKEGNGVDIGEVEENDDLAEQRRLALEEGRRVDANDSSDEEEEDSGGGGGGGDEEDDSSEEESEDDDEDDTAELMRELAKIKRERAIEKERKEREELEKREEEIASGNPLLLNSGNLTVKRRWDEDVVFKNQARGLEEKPKKRFVNDLLRSDFHRKFMSKYMK